MYNDKKKCFPSFSASTNLHEEEKKTSAYYKNKVVVLVTCAVGVCSIGLENEQNFYINIFYNAEPNSYEIHLTAFLEA